MESENPGPFKSDSRDAPSVLIAVEGAHAPTDGEPLTDGGENPRMPRTLTEHASVREREVCDGAEGHTCDRDDPELIRGEDAIHVTERGPGTDRPGRTVLCGSCKDRQTALDIAEVPDLARLYADELPDLRERFPDILADVETDGRIR